MFRSKYQYFKDTKTLRYLCYYNWIRTSKTIKMKSIWDIKLSITKIPNQNLRLFKGIINEERWQLHCILTLINDMKYRYLDIEISYYMVQNYHRSNWLAMYVRHTFFLQKNVMIESCNEINKYVTLIAVGERIVMSTMSLSH